MLLSFETPEIAVEKILHNLRLSRAKLKVMYALAQDNDESEMAHIIFEINKSIDDAITFLRKPSVDEINLK